MSAGSSKQTCVPAGLTPCNKGVSTPVAQPDKNNMDNETMRKLYLTVSQIVILQGVSFPRKRESKLWIPRSSRGMTVLFGVFNKMIYFPLFILSTRTGVFSSD